MTTVSSDFAGSWEDFPTLDEIRIIIGKDAEREI